MKEGLGRNEGGGVGLKGEDRAQEVPREGFVIVLPRFRFASL